MAESWDSWLVEIDRIVERVNAFVPVELVLVVAVGATAMVVWWLMRKLGRLAFYAGVVGAIAWWWYFGIPD